MRADIESAAEMLRGSQRRVSRTKAITIRRPDTSSKISYRSDIDGLRAVAVLSVIGFHILPNRIRGGFVGVDIFFVISGFLISSIIYKELEAGTFTIRGFYVRRIQRIYPALFIVLVCVATTGWFVLLPSEFVLLGKQIVGGSTFIANFVLWAQSGYFSPEAARKPLLHLWSLGVEEQFYLIFPLVCVVFYRARARRNLVMAFLTIAAASMMINVGFVTKYATASFFLPFSRLWELLLGAGLSLIRGYNWEAAENQAAVHKWSNVAGLLGTVMIVGAVFCIHYDDPFPGWWALLPTIGAALVIAAGPKSWVNHRVLSLPLVVLIGLISYPLYLWHWPLLTFLKIVDRDWDFHLPKLFQYLTVLVGTFVLSYLTYRFFELPIRQIKEKQQRLKTAFLLFACVGLAAVFGVFIIAARGYPTRFPAAIEALDHDFSAQESGAMREGSCLLRPDQTAAQFGENCLDPAKGHEGEPIIFIWGDSHAADLVPGFRELQGRLRIRLAQYTTSLCAPIIGLYVTARPACFSANKDVSSRIRDLKPNVVILSAYWDYLDIAHNPTLALKLQKTVEWIRTLGVPKVVVIGSAPFWSNDLPVLLIHALRQNPSESIPHRLTRKYLGPHDDKLLEMAVTNGGGMFLSIFDKLCDQETCMAITGSTWRDVLVWDTAHFTEHGSVIVTQFIWPSIQGMDRLSGVIGSEAK